MISRITPQDLMSVISEEVGRNPKAGRKTNERAALIVAADVCFVFIE